MNEKDKNKLIELIYSTIEATKEFAYNSDPYGSEGQNLWAKRDKANKELFDFINSL